MTRTDDPLRNGDVDITKYTALIITYEFKKRCMGIYRDQGSVSVFKKFRLHFIISCNVLQIIADLIDRDITPFYAPLVVESLLNSLW